MRLSEWKVESLKDFIGGCVEPMSTNLPQGIDKHCVSAILITLFNCAQNFRNDLLFGKGKMVEEVIMDFQRMVDDFTVNDEPKKMIGCLTKGWLGFPHVLEI